MLGVSVGSLRLAHVGEVKFIHQAVAESPRVSEVVLLKTLFDAGAEARHVRACSLKIIEWIEKIFVSEIVVGAEILLVVDAMVEPRRQLVLTVTCVQDRLK